MSVADGLALPQALMLCQRDWAGLDSISISLSAVISYHLNQDLSLGGKRVIDVDYSFEAGLVFNRQPWLGAGPLYVGGVPVLKPPANKFYAVKAACGAVDLAFGPWDPFGDITCIGTSVYTAYSGATPVTTTCSNPGSVTPVFTQVLAGGDPNNAWQNPPLDLTIDCSSDMRDKPDRLTISAGSFDITPGASIPLGAPLLVLFRIPFALGAHSSSLSSSAYNPLGLCGFTYGDPIGTMNASCTVTLG